MHGDVSSLPDLLRRSCSAHPARTAVVDGGRSLTYADLDARSGRLAARLVGCGVRPGELVGLAPERSADAVVAILSILRAGAAYVPLDRELPPDRLRLLVQDAGIRRLVGDPGEADRFGLPPGAAIRPDPGGADTCPGATDRPGPRPTDPAYVIYTSGSTGRPKGCVVTHANVLALLDAALPLFDVGPTDRWAQFHSCSFDFSVWEIWGALATGAAIVVVPRAAARSSDALLRVLIDGAVTVVNVVPSVFEYLTIAYAAAGRPPLPLRQLVFGGESVNLGAVRRFLAGWSGSPPDVVNMYGITETTVHATAKRITDRVLRGAVGSPIGVPLPHLTIELRDPAGRPVPPGEPGEMWIFGTGVCAGYLNRPDLTAERFGTLAGGHGGRRFFRSGDLARRLPDGELAYLGRTDEQVKLRGYRIELGEIEAVLRAGPGVRQAAVAVIERGAGAQVLAAVFVPSGKADVEAVRDHAAAALPAYMVPHRYLAVADLPLTASGKVDRAALRGLADQAGPSRHGRTR